jgi:hypothetical protein
MGIAVGIAEEIVEESVVDRGVQIFIVQAPNTNPVPRGTHTTLREVAAFSQPGRLVV